MSILTELFERAKAARQSDRALDLDIGCLVMNITWRPWGKRIPRYTQSFEAALTLLPPRKFVEVSGSTDTYDPGVWPAVSLRWLPTGQTDPEKWHGTVQGAPTFALAMCCAALEVRVRDCA